MHELQGKKEAYKLATSNRLLMITPNRVTPPASFRSPLLAGNSHRGVNSFPPYGLIFTMRKINWRYIGKVWLYFWLPLFVLIWIINIWVD